MLKLPPNLHRVFAVILCALLVLNLVLFGSGKIPLGLFWFIIGMIGLVCLFFFRKKSSKK